MNDGQEQQLIKRVIGLPGDRVVIHDGVVKIYNQDFPNGFNADQDTDHGDLAINTSGDIDLTLAKNQIYVMGDHRGNSKDSRYFGPISSDIIVGKLALRVLPLNKTKAF
jgi:signal peptidase I